MAAAVARRANLSCAATATLSFSYRRVVSVPDPFALVSVEIKRGDEVVYSTLESYPFSGSDGSMMHRSFNITPFISAMTKIRFRASGGKGRRPRLLRQRPDFGG